MNVNEPRKDNDDGNRRKPLYTLIVVSLIAAFVFAALPMSSASAAPTGPGGGSNGSNNGVDWQSQIQKLRADVSIANNFQTKPSNSCTTARYRDAYMATLRAAQTLVKSGGTLNVIPVTGNSSNGTSASGNANTTAATGLLMVKGRGGYYASHPEKLMAAYLHRLRMLREKMGSNDTPNNSDKNACLNNTNGTGTGTGTGTSTGTGTTSTPAPTAAPSATPSSTPSPTPTP